MNDNSRELKTILILKLGAWHLSGETMLLHTPPSASPLWSPSQHLTSALPALASSQTLNLPSRACSESRRKETTSLARV